jgi:kinesin family protein C1
LTNELLKKKIVKFETQQKTLLEENANLISENQKLRKVEQAHELVVVENLALKSDTAKMHELLFQSNVARKDLHNEVLDLKGNIRVFCRVRPPLDCEKGRMLCGWQYMDDTSLEISSIESGRKQQKHEFSFDQVFHPQSSQNDIFELVSPLIQSAFDGYNVCIFAYGQTGSGKTFTMEGTPSQIGIIPRTVDLLFESVQNYKIMGWTYTITVTFLEIYNEVLYDLLSNDQKELEIRMVNPKTPHEIVVSNLTEFTVENANDLCELIDVAKS